ncbi:MAG TPA: Ku protein [Acidobacteriaceae bacterium]|nr:Ku protein [Acidobacteriaceae bacterium]
MARPLWSGTIQISLVGFAVEVYPATSTTRPISFHEIDRNTMSRVRRASVSSGPAPDTSESSDEGESASKTSLHLAPPPPEEPAEHRVEKSDIVKGYEYEKGKYAIVEPDELKNLRLAGKKTIEISQFSPVAEVDPALYEKPYFVMPKAGPQAVAFSVMRQSMAESGMVGVGEIVFSGRQHLMTLAPPQDPNQPGMMLYTLRFAAEMRAAKDYSTGVEAVKADAAQLGLAKQLIAAYTQPFDINKFKDQYEDALRELVEAKMRNLPAPAPEVEKKPPQVVDLMEALRRSLAQAGSPAGTTKAEGEAAKSANGKTKAAGGAKRKKSA